MSISTFQFILACIGLGFFVLFVDWLYNTVHPRANETEKQKHQRLMRELRRRKDG